MREKISNFLGKVKSNKRYLAARVAFFLVFVVLLIFSLATRSLKKKSPSLSPTPTPKTLEKVTPSQAKSPPDVYFEEYENKAGTPKALETINTYTFKTNYTLEEALVFGRKLGLTEHKEDGDWVVMYNVTDKDKRGLLSFHLPTGSFSFQSWGIHKPQITSDGVLRLSKDSSEVKETAKRFLTELGIADKTVTCNITYQRKELPNATFVECHRNWEKTGLPILGYPGVLNVPEGRPLSKLALGEVDENTPRDKSIINVSGISPSEESLRATSEERLGDGKARPNDFNTATVAVSSDGRILSIESNLRQIVKTQQAGALQTPQQALNQFLSHNSQLSLTIPAGSGSVD